MGRKKPLVIVTRKLPDAVETRMCELFDARLNIDDKPLPRSALVEAMRAAEVIVPTVTDRIDAELIGLAGQQMKLIANFGNGVDNIDVTAALGRGMTVTNTPGVLTEDTADMTMALILAAARRRSKSHSRWRMDRLGADLDAWTPDQRQTARNRGHGPHRPGSRPSGQGFRLADPLS